MDCIKVGVSQKERMCTI